MKTNQQLELAYNFVQYTNKNIFLTGKAGTGKTTFLKRLKETLFKRMIVVAPTGVAAINAGGVTIHSFFQMPFGPILPDRINQSFSGNEMEKSSTSGIKRLNKTKINIIRSLDLLVIDEISMVRADLLDGIDEMLRRYRKTTLPFGGVQLLMIGDLQQLAPIAKDDELKILKQHYETIFFFGSKALQRSNYESIELTEVFRQSDNDFIKILNEVRENELTQVSLDKLANRYQPGFNPDDNEGYINLTTHNNRAGRINESKLQQLNSPAKLFDAEIHGIFPEHMYPTELNLVLKIGAQVMFVKNDSSPEKLYYNGKIGRIVEIENDTIIVKCPGEAESIVVHQEEWQNVSYSINEQSKEIDEKVIGGFVQYPLKLAWAITIHKSQGLTFEKVIIDANAAFAHGQVYVALSRCKSLEGLVLSTPISKEGIFHDQTVSSFCDNVEENQPGEQQLLQSKQEFQLSLLIELFDYAQILKLMYFCRKHVNENSGSILGNLGEKLEEIIPQTKEKLVDVADKFKGQLRKIVLEGTDSQLQERIKKASVYFLQHTDELLLTFIEQASFETDNKAVKKTLKGHLDELETLINQKHSCLDACIDGFRLRDYLELRAKSMLSESVKKKKTIEEPMLDSIDHPALFNQLRKWRKNYADERGRPAFWVASQKVLIQLVNEMPVSVKQLMEIKGLGKKKIQEFGIEILEIIFNYRRENGMTIPELPTKIDFPKKPAKEDTKKISFDLFKSGKTVDQIAGIREMVPQTIEGHLAHYVGLGELEINQFVTSDKISVIEKFFAKNRGLSLSEAKLKLPEHITYSDMRFVLKHMEVKK